jgi:anti-sigma factor RsiW
MKSNEPPGAHLEDEEIVLRVFPVGDGSSPVPLHLAACPSCQSRVARLREGALLEQGAIDGALESLPDEFWHRQELSVMQQVRSAAMEKRRVLPFRLPLSGPLLRHPTLAFGSLAAAILLVAGLSFSRFSPAPDTPVTRPVAVRETPAHGLLSADDRSDDELLLSVDRALSEESPISDLVPEDV